MEYWNDGMSGFRGCNSFNHMLLLLNRKYKINYKPSLHYSIIPLLQNDGQKRAIFTIICRNSETLNYTRQFFLLLKNWRFRSTSVINPNNAVETYYDFEKGSTCCVLKNSFGIKIFQYSSTKTALHTLRSEAFSLSHYDLTALSGLKV